MTLFSWKKVVLNTSYSEQNKVFQSDGFVRYIKKAEKISKSFEVVLKPCKKCEYPVIGPRRNVYHMTIFKVH